MIIQRTEEMLLTLPDNFNIAEAREQFQINYYESMNTVLIQEILRYNTLLNMLRSSLNDLLLALGGFKVMTANLENVIEGLLNNSIPQVKQNIIFIFKNVIIYMIIFFIGMGLEILSIFEIFNRVSAGLESKSRYV